MLHADYKVVTGVVDNYNHGYESTTFSNNVSYELGNGWELYGDLQVKNLGNNDIILIQPLVRYS